MKRILVTGGIRTGTSWTGRVLAEARDTGYILEPFNTDPHVNFYPKPFPDPYYYVCEENADLYLRAVRDMVSFRYPLFPSILRAPANANEYRLNTLKSWAKYKMCRARGVTAIVKDPHALFSTNWLASEFEMRVVVTIRHPAAFVSSLKTVNWPFEFGYFSFSHFRCQELLMRDYLQPFAEEIEKQADSPGDTITQGALFWKCVYHVVSIYQRENPTWSFVRHEDLSANPVSAFTSLFRTLGLEYSERVEKMILATTDPKNPVDQVVGQGTSIFRNSEANATAWKSKLTPAEIDRVRAATHEISRSFYSDDEW